MVKLLKIKYIFKSFPEASLKNLSKTVAALTRILRGIIKSLATSKSGLIKVTKYAKTSLKVLERVSKTKVISLPPSFKSPFHSAINTKEDSTIDKDNDSINPPNSILSIRRDAASCILLPESLPIILLRIPSKRNASLVKPSSKAFAIPTSLILSACSFIILDKFFITPALSAV